MPIAVLQGMPQVEAVCEVKAYASGTSNVEYRGYAKSIQPAQELAITSVSKAAAAVITSTAHGLVSGNGVTISGATAGWVGINGKHRITVTGNDTFTVAVDSSAFTGDFNGTVSFTCPREKDACWAIEFVVLSGADDTRVMRANGTGAPTSKWNDRASLIYA